MLCVCVLGALFTPDLALEKLRSPQRQSVPSVFFQLHQLCCTRCSLDCDSAATLVQPFVTSRIDYGNAVLANAPKIPTDKLQWVLNATTEVIIHCYTEVRLGFDAHPPR